MARRKIETPFPSNALIAKTLGISKDRANHIGKLVDTLFAHPKTGQSAFPKDYPKKHKTKGIKKAAPLRREKR